MKKLTLLTIPIFLFATDEALLKRIEFLEKELKILKEIALKKDINIQSNIIPQSDFEELKKQVASNSQDISDIYPIVEQNEKKSILDKINFSPELELRADSMSYKSGEIDGEDTTMDGTLATEQRRDQFSKSFEPSGYVRFRLNMNAEFDENLKFNGRAVFSTSSQTNERLCILSRDIKSGSSISAFDFDRAYVDYTLNKDSDYATTFSFGLLPTTGGTPMQFAQDAKRKSLFPALVFDMNTYGIIGTQKLLDDNFLRVVLAKAYTMRDTYYPYQCNRENIDNATIVGAYYDTKFNFFGNALLSVGINSLLDLKAHPYLGPDVDANNANVLGDMFTLGLGIDIEKFANTKTTLFLHTAMSNPNGNGADDDYQIVAGANVDSNSFADNPNQTLSEGLTASGEAGFSTADYAKGEMLSSNGYSVYLGAKYDINNEFSIGSEYNYGSKYWFSATQGAENMFNKLATRGWVSETYAIWNYYKNLSAKIGYMYTKENYTGSGWHFGEPAKKDAIQQVGYINLKAKF
ncbi:MAG: DUF3373 family protein [Campylobacterales bacterium]|nr:DUF3373 family protein [Campylobacterales bacterium]